jgi:predicted transcriptional regulator
MNTIFKGVHDMPTVSVKLAPTTKEQLDRIATSLGTTAHALMVHAIESTLDAQEVHLAFVARALASRRQVEQGALVQDGPGFADYLRARVSGKPAARPSGKPLSDFATPQQP